MRGRRGFTLIELMLVVAIIGLMAAIAIPKFADMVIKAKEAATRGALGSLRSAISLYFANNEGAYPTCIGVAAATQCLPIVLVPTYILDIPAGQAPTGNHASANGVNFMFPTPMVPEWNAYTGVPGAWYYDVIGGLATRGTIHVNCTHMDNRGMPWSTQ